jgi:predicted nucleic acid-binding protein
MFSEKAMNFVAKVIDRVPNISVITEIEALSWLNPDKRKEMIIREFINDANVVALSSKVVAQCVQLRRSKKIKTPDAIIAATAIVHGFTLITSDADFNNIQDLTLIDPYSL